MGFKKTIISFLAPYQYPQIIFGQELLKLIRKTIPAPKSRLLDCPCGNGEVSNYLSREKNLEITGVDLDESSVKNAKNHFKANNLSFSTSDIFDFYKRNNKTYDYICLVNSLFLLPDHPLLFSEIKRHLKSPDSVFFIIIPNIESRGFNYFQNNNPNINKTLYNKEKLVQTLKNEGFLIQNVKEIVYFRVYGRKELRYFSVLAPFYLYFLNKLASFRIKKAGNYVLISCTKT